MDVRVIAHLTAMKWREFHQHPPTSMGHFTGPLERQQNNTPSHDRRGLPSGKHHTPITFPLLLRPNAKLPFNEHCEEYENNPLRPPITQELFKRASVIDAHIKPRYQMLWR